jgi:hypothetical protein
MSFENGNGEQGPEQNNGDFYEIFSNGGKPKTLGWSVASMVTGILSVLCCCLGWTGLVFGAAAVILSIVSRKSLGYFDGMSIAGLVMGIFGFVFGASMVYMLYFNEEFWAEYEKYFWEQYNQMNPEI